jgi:hypothetical protein
MTPEEYRRQLDAITAALRAVLVPLVRTLRGRPTAAQWSAFLDAAYPAIYRARVQSWQLAADFYAAQRRAQLAPAPGGDSSRRDETTAPTSDEDVSTREETTEPGQLTAVDGGRDETPDVPRRNYPPQALAAAYRPLRARLDALDADARVPDTTAEQAVRVAERHARDAGREAVVDAARNDPAALGYARRALSGNPCAFCLMLVSRGPVYKDASAALRRDGESEPYHDGCSCLAVPVFNRQSWPGRDEADELERQWREHGGTLAAWRRYIDEQRQQFAEGSTAAAS